MKMTVLSLFPSIVDAFFASSIMAKSLERGIIAYQSVDVRNFAEDRHRTCDDAPYGGGAGMVLKAEPLGRALEHVDARSKRTVYATPAGRLLTQEYAAELAQESELVFVCGRYEGVDQRIIDLYVDDEISIGDYVVSSGEIATLVIVDAVYRLIDGVISAESLEEESFADGLLEYPHYTRPEVYEGLRVPDVLLSGHHENIRRWRLARSVEKTIRYRPDLLEQRDLPLEIRRLMDDLRKEGADDGRNKGS